MADKCKPSILAWEGQTSSLDGLEHGLEHLALEGLPGDLEQEHIVNCPSLLRNNQVDDALLEQRLVDDSHLVLGDAAHIAEQPIVLDVAAGGVVGPASAAPFAIVVDGRCDGLEERAQDPAEGHARALQRQRRHRQQKERTAEHTWIRRALVDYRVRDVAVGHYRDLERVVRLESDITKLGT